MLQPERNLIHGGGRERAGEVRGSGRRLYIQPASPLETSNKVCAASVCRCRAAERSSLNVLSHSDTKASRYGDMDVRATEKLAQRESHWYIYIMYGCKYILFCAVDVRRSTVISGYFSSAPVRKHTRYNNNNTAAWFISLDLSIHHSLDILSQKSIIADLGGD